MPKGQPLSRHQEGIVKRYYANLDNTTITKLQELSSDLYLAADEKTRTKLWKSVDLWLSKTGIDAAICLRVLEKKDPKLLAEFVNSLSARK